MVGRIKIKLAKSEYTFVWTLTLQETLEENRYRLRYVFRPLYRSLLNIIAIFFLILGIYRLIYFDFSFFPVLLIIGSLYAIIGWRIEINYRIKRQFKKYENEDRETIVRLNDETVYLKNELMETRFDWKVIKCVVNGPRGILVQVNNHQNLFYLPYHLIKDEKFRCELID